MKDTLQQTPETKQRVALYGGSFDPIHSAHLQVARYAYDAADLAKVVFIPAAQSPLKKHSTFASDAERVEMLRLAIDGDERFAIDTREIERGATSYTVDTVSEIRRTFPEWSLFWILGADQVELLPNWRQIDELASMVTFLVLSRPGYSHSAPDLRHFAYKTVEAPLMEQSSSEIRARLKTGRSCGDWLPPAVDAFISAKGLYTQ